MKETNATPPSGHPDSPRDQTRTLPPDFDPSKYPHYSVQSSIYSLLLSALNLSEHYERYPGMEERQRLLETIVRDYQDTCEPVKFNQPKA